MFGFNIGRLGGVGRLKNLTSIIKAMFANGEQGWWYDPSNMSTLFQDAAGTTPVTAMEQPVGLQLDLSKGLVLGPELVTNGDFSTDTVWTKGEGWTIANGKATRVPSTFGSVLSQPLSVTAGRLYQVTYTVLDYVAQDVQIVFIGGTQVGGSIRSANDTYTEYMFAASGNNSLWVRTGIPTTQLSIDNISVRELPGNHRFQSTSANRPVVSARVNLLTKTEQFDDAAWLKYNATVTANTSTAPDGKTTADTFAVTSTVSAVYVSVTPLGAMNWAIRAKQNTNRYVALVIGNGVLDAGYVVFDLQTGVVGQTVSGTGTTGVSGRIFSEANGFFTCVISFTRTTVANFKIELAPALTGNTLDTFGDIAGNTIGNSVFIWGADLRPANQGVNLPAYQRVNTSTDYDTVGFPVYIKPNGSNQFMQTNSINFSATDKMTVWQGVRKLSTSTAVPFELSVNAPSNNGTFGLYGPDGGFSYGFLSRGSSSGVANTSGSLFVPPVTNVLTCIGDISGDVANLRVNGTQTSSSSADQGTGNYGNYPAYFYMRAGTSLPFNGHDYGSIARGAASTAAQIAAGETYINSKTKAY